MSFFRGDASEIYELAADMTAITAKMVPALRAGMAQAGESVTDEWRRNAREHFHEDGHASRYDDSIDSELVFDATGISVDVGPNAGKMTGGKNQAFLGPVLEFGNETTPAYLDGLRAVDGSQQRIERMIDATIGHLLP